MHKRIIAMRDTLASCIEYQLQHIEEVDCCELGEAIDMLKDLEETLYFHAITEAMKGEGAYGDWPETNKKKDYHIINNHSELDGKSYQNRRMYIEAKSSKDKATQLRELEKYMQELTSDMIDMIQDASIEEKTYLEKKITTLANKIGQMK